MRSDSRIVPGKAAPLGRYPHVKLAGGFAFVSGTSSRMPDGTIAGADVDEDVGGDVDGGGGGGDPATGGATLDIRVQTRAVIEKIAGILGEVGADLADLVSVTTYLVDMDDFDGYNEVYGTFFDENAPARTTIAVLQLPHPHLLIEMQAIAALPGETAANRDEGGPL